MCGKPAGSRKGGVTHLAWCTRRADAVTLFEMLEFFKKRPETPFIPDLRWKDDLDERSSRIRCPLCQWQPSPSSVWACESYGTPEPYFGGCGTMWNTFSTGGKCPGCKHQWQWTSCPNCGEWSLHEDWYEAGH